jgi:hypothetical protein
MDSYFLFIQDIYREENEQIPNDSIDRNQKHSNELEGNCFGMCYTYLKRRHMRVVQL